MLLSIFGLFAIPIALSNDIVGQEDEELPEEEQIEVFPVDISLFIIIIAIIVGIIIWLKLRGGLVASKPPSGRDPTEEEKKKLKGAFPKLKDGEWKVTGPKTCKYNCIEWSLCQSAKWLWNQVDKAGDKDGKVEVEDFDAFYKKKGYTKCGTSSADCKPECKKRKVALFAKAGKPTHAAKEVADGGWWESKLGKHVKIIHRLDQLEGGFYGDVVRCYCKDDPTANLKLCKKKGGSN